MTLLFLAAQSQAGKTLVKRALEICVPKNEIHIHMHTDLPFFFLETYRAINDDRWKQIEIRENLGDQREFVFTMDHQLPPIEDPVTAAKKAFIHFQQTTYPDVKLFGDFSQTYYTPDRYRELCNIFPEAKYIILFREPAVITPLRRKLLEKILGKNGPHNLEERIRNEQEQMRASLTREENELVIDVAECKRKPKLGLRLLLEHIGIDPQDISNDRKEKAITEIIRFKHEDIPSPTEPGDEK